MATRRPLTNPLALAVLVSLYERPMHPYELASTLRERGKDSSIKINWGSLYTVVRNLEKHGLVEPAETTRQGKRPERTTYRITEAGTAEMTDWMRELLGFPNKEYSLYEAALSLLGVISPDETMVLLEQRLRRLDVQLAGGRAMLEEGRRTLPRLFLLEVEYELAMRSAEAEWTRALLADLTSGTFPGLAEWRKYHEAGSPPAGWTAEKEAPAEPTPDSSSDPGGVRQHHHRGREPRTDPHPVPRMTTRRTRRHSQP